MTILNTAGQPLKDEAATSPTPDPYKDHDKAINDILETIPADDDNGTLYLRFSKDKVHTWARTKQENLFKAFYALLASKNPHAIVMLNASIRFIQDMESVSHTQKIKQSIMNNGQLRNLRRLKPIN